MTNTLLRLAIGLALTAWLACTAAFAADWRVVFLTWPDNPDFDRSRTERAYLGHPTGSASEGFAMAVSDARIELDAAGADIKVEVQPVNSADAARAAALKAQAGGAHALVTELPAQWTLEVANASKLPVINVLAGNDSLRSKDCRANLFHTIPSERMRADAMAQALVARKWTQVLLLAGSGAQDMERLATVSASMRRFGLKTVAQKNFKLSADPRERALANPLLLSAGLSYDAAWVVDSQGEFARNLPYNLAQPRPVVGDAGMVAVAWHPQFERFGAPQVSRRFQKAAKRPMTGQDWAAWVAGKAIASLAASPNKPSAAAIQQTLTKTPIDGSKGTVMGFRAWDGQLRQPIILTDGQGVLGQAPFDGVLHPTNNLDTLGADGPEKLCGVPR